MLTEQIIRTLLKKECKERIEGWGLQPPIKNADWFTHQLGRYHGCTNPRCSHSSHDPAGYDVYWIPREEIYCLRAFRQYGDGNYTDYYLATNGQELRIIGVWRMPHFSPRVIATFRIQGDADIESLPAEVREDLLLWLKRYGCE